MPSYLSTFYANYLSVRVTDVSMEHIDEHGQVEGLPWPMSSECRFSSTDNTGKKHGRRTLKYRYNQSVHTNPPLEENRTAVFGIEPGTS